VSLTAIVTPGTDVVRGDYTTPPISALHPLTHVWTKVTINQ
jgi:hypothetical protein